MLRGIIINAFPDRPNPTSRLRDPALGQINITEAALAYQKLGRLDIPVSVVVPRRQSAPYARVFPVSHLILPFNHTARSGGDPLSSILAAHFTFPSDDLLVLAGEARIRTSVLQNLISLYLDPRTQSSFLFPGNAGKIDPLCGIYRAAGIIKLFWSTKRSPAPRVRIISNSPLTGHFQL